MIGQDSKITLYLYTSLAGLIGIAQSKVLWGTHIGYLNDASELRFAIGLLHERISDRIGNSSRDESKCLVQLNEWLKSNILFKCLVFTCSFTTNGDLLSQWRGYCPVGKGVSLGFDPDELAEVAHDQDFELVPCVYEREKQLTLVDEWLTQVLEIAATCGEKPNDTNAGPTKSYYYAFRFKVECLLRTAAQIKHPGFVEEAEWRAITGAVWSPTNPKLHFRDGKTNLIPYIDFSLPRNCDGGLSLKHAYLGPTPENNLSLSSFEMNLTNHSASPKEKPTASGIPWRT